MICHSDVSQDFLVTRQVIYFYLFLFKIEKFVGKLGTRNLH